MNLLTPKHILMMIAMLLAVIAMIFPTTGHYLLAVAVLLLAVVNLIP